MVKTADGDDGSLEPASRRPVMFDVAHWRQGNEPSKHKTSRSIMPHANPFGRDSSEPSQI